MNIRSVAHAPEPEQLFEVLRTRPGSFWLDSAMTGALGRYSFMGSRPYRVLRQRGADFEDTLDERRRVTRANPFTELKRLLPRLRDEVDDSPTPFVSGAVGYLGYELNHFIEKLPGRARRDSRLPDMCLGFYDSVVTYDHLTGQCWVTGSRPGAGERENREAMERTLRELDEAAKAKPGEIDPGAACIEEDSLRSNFTHEEYLRVIQRTIDYIGAGDIFQANISQRFQARPTIAAHELYRRLRRNNPAPCAAWLDAGEGCAVLSSSPERFLAVTGRRVETRPIKGTRRRTGNEAEDARMRRELVESAKDNAELAMIVDLERNDLGRVSSYGSVKVTDRCALETYATVYHLVATVVGELHADKDVSDLLRATFPGGSITGAPKIRAMEIIDEMEPTARSLYTGAIGYFDDSGRVDLNIAIRTVLMEPGRLTFQVGGGIVADSVPELEYQETLDKGRGILRALGVAEEKIQSTRATA